MPKILCDSLQYTGGHRLKKRTWILAGMALVSLFLPMGLLANGLVLPGQPLTEQAAREHPSFVVKSEGTGPAILMIPGLSSSASTWDGTVDHLKGRFRCITINLAGFAGVAPLPGLTLGMVRDQLAEYIRSEHLVRPIIVGHSLGGSIAMDLAAKNPTLVGPVVIVDALPFTAGAWFGVTSADAAKPILAQMGAGMRAMNAAQWEAYQRAGASTRTMASSAADQQKLVAWGLASDQKTVTDTMLELLGEDLRGEMKQIQTPVLVIGTWAGLQSPGVTRAAVTELFEQQFDGVRHLKLVMADNERHFVMWDNPKWFDATLDGFLKKNAVS